MKPIKIWTFIGLCTILSCNDETILESINEQQSIPNEIDEEPYKNILGRKLENPYSLSNMRRALDAINSHKLSKTAIDASIIEATHLYVKFLPKTYMDEAVLSSDTTLELYPYPLDYELVEGNRVYDETDIDTLPKPKFAAIPISHPIPNVKHEIIDSLCILFEGKDEENSISKSLSHNKMIWEELEQASLEITGNASDISISKKSSSWRPSGCIYVKDDILGRIGLEGVKVRARRFFTTHTGIADANGKYSCDGTFKGPANYSIKLDRADFNIKDSYLRDYDIDGPKKECSWYYTFSGNDDRFYATLFRGAYQWYYKNNTSLSRPPQCNVRGYTFDNHDCNGNFSAGRKASPFSNAIHVYRNNRTSEKVFATTIHELTHAAHWDIANKYNSTDKCVKESWAVGVQNYTTPKIYPNYERKSYDSEYTNIVYDLIHGTIDHSIVTNKKSSRYYSIKEIEGKVKISTTWNELKNNIKSITPNEKYLDSLFSYWANY